MGALNYHDDDPEFQRLLLHSALEKHKLAQMFFDEFVLKVYQFLGAYIHERRENDFVDNLCRKLMAYALGRGLMLSDEPAIEEMRGKLAANQYRFQTLIESIVTSPQFLNGRKPDTATQKGE